MQGGGGLGANLQRPRLRYAPDDDSLFNVIRKGIAGTGMPGIFAMTDDETRDVIAPRARPGPYSRRPLPGDPHKVGSPIRKRSAATVTSSPARAGNLGPELSDVGDRRGILFLRKALLHPGMDRTVSAEGYATHLPMLAVTRDGRMLTGVRVNEDTFTIQLRDSNKSPLLAAKKRSRRVEQARRQHDANV